MQRGTQGFRASRLMVDSNLDLGNYTVRGSGFISSVPSLNVAVNDVLIVTWAGVEPLPM